MEELKKRSQQAAESILGNERLTSDLTDEPAKALLDLGVAMAEHVAQSTAGLDATAAEDAMYPRLRATRRLMQKVNKWLGGGLADDTQASEALLDEVIAQAKIIYGEYFAPPTTEERIAFIEQCQALDDQHTQIISKLRTLIEPHMALLSQSGEEDEEAKHIKEDKAEEERSRALFRPQDLWHFKKDKEGKR